jgi:hypothetical protein
LSLTQRKTLKFTPPNEKNGELPRYASYVVGDGMKLHRSIGHAKNSLNHRGYRVWRWMPDPERRHSFILENVDGSWYVLYEIPDGCKDEDLPWMKEYFVYSRNGTVFSFLYTDYHRQSIYYKDLLADGKARLEKRSCPMSMDEYVTWRLAVEREIVKDRMNA